VTETALTQAAQIAVRRGSPLMRWFWRFFISAFVFIVSVSTYDFLMALVARNAVIGGIATAAVAGVLLLLLLLILREIASFGRLRRIDHIADEAREALENDNLTQAQRVTGRLAKLYRSRPDTSWGLARFKERAPEVFDADALIGLAEVEVVAPLDTAAQKEVETAARKVATATAIVPLALVDVVVAVSANLTMIRKIAEIYGGRSGVIGSWRIARAVLTHMVATGAVAIGDDLISSVLGGGALSKISRRFGEGVINGALTARVGLAAMDVCRPLPFTATDRPSVSGTVKRALVGLFKAQ